MLRAVSTGVASNVTNITTYTINQNPGLVALTGKKVATTVNGLTTSHRIIGCYVRDDLSLGIAIGNVRVSAANTLEIYWVTGIALGVTLGSLTIDVTVAA